MCTLKCLERLLMCKRTPSIQNVFTMNLSFQKLFYAVATVLAFFTILILAKTVLIPLAFALLFSFILFPVVKRFDLWGMNSILSAFLPIFTVILIIAAGMFLFSTQLIDLVQEFSHFQDKIILAFSDVTIYINNNLNFVPNLEKNELFDQIKVWLSDSIGMLIPQAFSSTANFLTGLLATIIFTFLILIYRTGLVRALSAFAHEDKNEHVVNMFKSVLQVGQQYLYGVVILILVIGLANSFGLWIIGIDNPFLFGFLGAILAVIPYVGTVSGAIIPALYGFISYNSIWISIEVVVLFWAVQLISDNLLSPKIVGGNMHINALTSILSLIVGAVVWGVAGMILFLPFAAMLKVFSEEFIELKPIALLIGNQNYQDNDGKTTMIKKWVDKIKAWFLKFRKS